MEIDNIITVAINICKNTFGGIDIKSKTNKYKHHNGMLGVDICLFFIDKQYDVFLPYDTFLGIYEYGEIFANDIIFTIIKDDMKHFENIIKKNERKNKIQKINDTTSIIMG